jgi:LemA protein
MDLAWLVGLGVIGLLVLAGIVIYNRLVGLGNQVQNAWRQIDVQLKRRHDLIPNFVEVVKDYMSFEQETLRQVIEARAGAVKAATPTEVIAAEGILSGAIGRLFGLVENYPNLKADQNVQRLLEELSGTENKISFARQFYNDSVMEMNTAVEAFPSNLVAGAFRFARAEYFVAPEAETAAPKVDLR